MILISWKWFPFIIQPSAILFPMICGVDAQLLYSFIFVTFYFQEKFGDSWTFVAATFLNEYGKQCFEVIILTFIKIFREFSYFSKLAQHRFNFFHQLIPAMFGKCILLAYACWLILNVILLRLNFLIHSFLIITLLNLEVL